MRNLLIAFFAVVLAGCPFQRAEVWTAFVYLDGDLERYLILGQYDSLAMCRQAAVVWLIEHKQRPAGNYECGLACRVDATVKDLNVCKETED